MAEFGYSDRPQTTPEGFDLSLMQVVQSVAQIYYPARRRTDEPVKFSPEYRSVADNGFHLLHRTEYELQVLSEELEDFYITEN